MCWSGAEAEECPGGSGVSSLLPVLVAGDTVGVSEFIVYFTTDASTAVIVDVPTKEQALPAAQGAIRSAPPQLCDRCMGHIDLDEWEPLHGTGEPEPEPSTTT
jgi:hypothetical protein